MVRKRWILLHTVTEEEPEAPPEAPPEAVIEETAAEDETTKTDKPEAVVRVTAER